ncbi:MAG: hypothetical protein HYS08_06245 [Chlamydiae bacterium]|nr:hypothetical protein [Chlamydiota bacterium]
MSWVFKVMLVYLDTNIYCRPMDDQAKGKIRQETEAVLQILRWCRENKMKLLGSDMLRYEVTQISNVHKREEVRRYLRGCDSFVEQHVVVLALAQELEMLCGVGGRDAIHLSSAVIGNAEVFLTCDMDIVKKRRRINLVLKKLNRILDIENPVGFRDSFKEE